MKWYIVKTDLATIGVDLREVYRFEATSTPGEDGQPENYYVFLYAKPAPDKAALTFTIPAAEYARLLGLLEG